MIFAEGFVYQTSWMFSWVFRLWPTSQTMGLTTNMASLTFQWLTRMKRNYRRSFKTRRKTVQAEEPHWALRTSQSGGLQSVHRIAATPRNPNICTKPLNRKWVTWSHENFSCHLIIIQRPFQHKKRCKMLKITNDKEKYLQEFFLEFYQSVKWIVVEIKSEKSFLTLLRSGQMSKYDHKVSKWTDIFNFLWNLAR